MVVIGLSLSSSWGNGHATTYRALLRALAARGHEILFLERDVSWYAEHRDLKNPSYCRLAFYDDLNDLKSYRDQVAAADAVIVGSYVPQGIEVSDWILGTARGLTAFYDIDTPLTLASLEACECDYIAARQIPSYDLYFSFTGGPILELVERRFGARRAIALHCSVDIEIYRRRNAALRWHLGYLGTYSPDRQPTLERLLLEPAEQMPSLRFVVAGPQYPSAIRWPANVSYIPHLAPADHPQFYSSVAWALNVTRADMVKAGHSPSVRLFEAAACSTPIISDRWCGLADLFRPAKEIVIAESSDDVRRALALAAERRKQIGAAARQRVLGDRAGEATCPRSKPEPNTGTYVSNTTGTYVDFARREHRKAGDRNGFRR